MRSRSGRSSAAVPPNPCMATTQGAPPGAKNSTGPCPSMVEWLAPVLPEKPNMGAPSLALAALDLVRANLLVQIRALDAEQDGGARNVPPGRPKRLDDVAPLGPLAVLAQREGLAGGGGRQGRGGGGDAGRVQRGIVVAAVGPGRNVVGFFLEGARVRVFGQIGDGHPIAAQDGASFDGVLQLAHVAGPLASDERMHDRVVDGLGARAIFARELLHERVIEQRDVVDSLAERRAPNRKDREAKVEVFAKGPGLDALGQVFVGRREDANVDVDDVLAAYARDFARLHGSEHFGLRDDVHVADFVEEERAAVGLLEEASTPEQRAGERAAFVTKELALDEFPRNGRAVDLDERAVDPGAEAVDRARDELFARAAFSRDEHGGFGGRDLFDLVKQPLKGRGAADHLVALELLLGDASELAVRPRGVDDVAHAHENTLARQGLLEEVAGAELDGLDGVVDGGVPADDDDRQVAGRLVGVDFRERFEAAHVGQLHVEHEQIDGGLGARQHLETRAGRLRADDAVAIALEHELQLPDMSGL